ncbi:MAG: sugar phosphate isomerase/epimerase [Bacteroidota bacterium]
MNRRKFIERTGILSAATLFPLAACTEKETKEMKEGEAFSPKYKLGYQLFSIRDEMAKDPIATLKALKAEGYKDFEHYGYDEAAGTFYGFQPAELKKMLEEMELNISSGHYGFSPFLEKSDDELKRFVDGCIAGSKALGADYIVWPWLAPEQRNLESYKIMIPKLQLLGKQITDAGLGFAYHNHGYEFEDLGGTTVYDMIMNETDPSEVKLQIDMYWLKRSSNYTPQQLIDKQPGRFTMWHLKDMDPETEDYTELGNGSIDYTTFMPDPKISGLEYFYIEQGGNFTHNSMQSAIDSAKYYKKHLQKFL